MGVVTPDLPKIRTGRPMEDVEGVTFGEYLGAVAIYGDPVIGTHVVAQLISVEIRGPGPYEVIGGYVARRATRERGEVSVDFVSEIASAPLPIFRIDRVVYFVYNKGDLHPIQEMLCGYICVPIQYPLLCSVGLLVRDTLPYLVNRVTFLIKRPSICSLPVLLLPQRGCRP